MSARPIHLPVCRLSHALSCAQPTLWRRAQAGIYGPLTRDARGRQRVELAAVELAEGIVFTDAQIAAMLGRAATNCVQQRAKRERLHRLFPPPMQVTIPDSGYIPRTAIPDLIAGYIARRDEQWIARLAGYFGAVTSNSQL